MESNVPFSKTRMLVLVGLVVGLCLIACARADKEIPTGNVIFIHPDGTSASMWNALRLSVYGPDSLTNWDRMDHLGIYRSHVLNSSNSSSHAGATIHAYGVKVSFNTFGRTAGASFQSLAGTDKSIMIEARDAGLATALINSGHICEPGTAVFVASSAERAATDTISEQVIESGVDIIFSGGETLLLPKGITGRHGEMGVREDGKNLIDRARELGYTIVYTREEMLALPLAANKVLGVFAAHHTFNDEPEEALKQEDLPLYNADAPTVAEMTATALNILDAQNRQFLLVVEEEGTDNFGNCNNAPGVLMALLHADQAIGLAQTYISTHPNTLLITAADSEAGGMQVSAVRDSTQFEKPLPAHTDNDAPLDGREGTGTLPFVAAPDQNGTRLHYGIAWAGFGDVMGSVIARAHGLNAGMLKANVDNTDIYRIMYATLFGIKLPAYNPVLE